MKKLLLLAPFLLAVVAPKFHFMDCVVVKNGFYEGNKGNVRSFYFNDKTRQNSYEVVSDNAKGQTFVEQFDESDLASCFGSKE